MDIPAKKLLRLLHAGQPEHVRAAAVLVAGELGVRDADLATEILARLDDSSETVRENAIRAVGQLRIEKALPTLLERIVHGGTEANLAAEAAAQLGAKAVKALQELMGKVAPGLRRYIAAALTSSGGSGAEAAGVAVLLDKDPQVAASAASAIIARIPTLTPDRKSSIAEELIALASDKKHPLPPTAELPIVRVLAALNVSTAADVLWDHLHPNHLPEVRALALQTVGSWIEKPTKDQWNRLFACAAETEFRIAGPALMILNRLPLSEKQVPEWVKLLHAPDVAARRLALDKIGDRDTSEIADALMDQLTHSDRGLRDAARAKLVHLSAGKKALARALLDAPNAESAWNLARSVAPFVKEFPPAVRTEILTQACDFLEAHDHRSDALLFLLREADASATRDALFEKAVALRKKKKYESAMVYLKTVARDPSIGFPIRLEIGLNSLKISPKTPDAANRTNDPCLGHLRTLIDQNPEQLLKEIEKAKWLEPADLFYVGFHFTEQLGPSRQFGADVLKLVLKRSPKGELAKSAKNKLKQSGMT